MSVAPGASDRVHLDNLGDVPPEATASRPTCPLCMARPCAVDRRMCNSCKSYRRRHRERFGFAADRPQAAIFNPRPTTKPADRKSEKIPSFEDEDSLTWQEWVRLTGYDPQTRTYRP